MASRIDSVQVKAGLQRMILQIYVKTCYNTSKKMQICLYKSALVL